MTITFIVQYKAVDHVTRYLLGFIPITKQFVTTRSSEYRLKHECKSIEEVKALEVAVQDMLSDFYGHRLISIDACDFGDYPDIVEHRPLAAGISF